MDDIFLDPSKLPSLLPGYHPRPTQMKAASLIDDALYNYKNIVLEAPTGSGKTMSYLVPVFSQGKRTIISTKTKQLMQQLYLKDIPVMEELFAGREVALLKGRKNYFCPHRFLRWVYPNSVYYQDVIDWYNLQDGDACEIPVGLFDGSILDKMSADSRQCIYNKCNYFGTCPFYTARNKANAASVVITNHYLLLTDIAMKADDSFGTVFEPADHIIFDEAHSVPDIYSNFAGAELSLRRLVNTLLDYKDKLAFDKLNQLVALQDKIAACIPEGKIPYSAVKESMYEFMDACNDLVETAAESDLTDEFNRWAMSFEVIDSDGEGVRFAEQRGRETSLRFIPLHSGGEFMEGLYRETLSSVFISATLTSNGAFDYFLRESGLDESTVTTVILPSVFNMRAQAKLLVPDVSDDKKDETMTELVKSVRGSALIICNSVKRMEQLTRKLSENQDKVVFSQNDGDWSTFTSNENIVLVGCASLREGIDLAGGDFRCVIIDKLPFEYPHDPYLVMKAKAVEMEQGNSFINFNLPRAVLYFKQAAGRLIRHESDKGVLAVFDNRIFTRRYGSAFLEALGEMERAGTVAEASAFLNE